MRWGSLRRNMNHHFDTLSSQTDISCRCWNGWSLHGLLRRLVLVRTRHAASAAAAVLHIRTRAWAAMATGAHECTEQTLWGHYWLSGFWATCCTLLAVLLTLLATFYAERCPRHKNHTTDSREAAALHDFHSEVYLRKRHIDNASCLSFVKLCVWYMYILSVKAPFPPTINAAEV